MGHLGSLMVAHVIKPLMQLIVLLWMMRLHSPLPQVVLVPQLLYCTVTLFQLKKYSHYLEEATEKVQKTLQQDV